MESGMKFVIKDEKELKAIRKFKQHHCYKCKIYDNSGVSIPPLFTYSFTPTGIADAVTIKCTFCGEEENVTNYDIW